VLGRGLKLSPRKKFSYLETQGKERPWPENGLKHHRNIIIIIIIIIINAYLFAETLGFLTAIQDQVILIRNYKKLF
jgi:hypothetical protein